MTEEEEKEEVEEEAQEETDEEMDIEEELEEELEEDGNEFSTSEITAVPMILCPDDEVPMEIKDVEVREVEKRKFIIKKTTEQHRHLDYECPECGKHFFYDLQRERQGCFIATAAFGTPMAEEINVLRRFRDAYLIHRDWGRKLISTYYTLSPPVADLISKSEPLKKLVRTALIPIVDLFKDKYGKED